MGRIVRHCIERINCLANWMDLKGERERGREGEIDSDRRRGFDYVSVTDTLDFL